MFTVALFTLAKIGKQPKCPSTDEWIKKLLSVYLFSCDMYMKYYSGLKKAGNPAICNNTDELGGHYTTLSEISQSQSNIA